MKKITFVTVISLLGLLRSVPARATSLPNQVFQLVVDTSSIAGTTGAIDFQFNPGPNTFQSATVQVSAFEGAQSTSDQKAGSVIGGPLPSALTMNNTRALNEDLESIMFGNTFSLTLNFSGTAINNPSSSNPQSGSIFTLGLFSDAAATMPVLTYDSNGFIFEEIINPGGQFTTEVISPQASLVPEPGSGALVGLAAFVITALQVRRQTPKRKSVVEV